jgi:predicted short-subunit dehydrogenase-like oxidoreductase (DUF2520 family)
MKNQYLIVGSGRVARHFAEYCRLLQQPFLTWSRKQNVSDSDLQRQSSLCSHVLLLISDSAIADFLTAHPFLREKVLVHFSGALEIEGVASAHPLMTFGPELYTLLEYQRIPFVLTEGSPFAEILPGLPNPSFHLRPQDKAYYHAWCVMSGNFTTLLWQNLRARLETMGLPADIIQPYFEQTTKNILINPQGALTGPLARRDLVTVEKNLRALREHHDSFEKVYRAFKDVVLEE